jgi:hypothetical protein
MSESERLKRGQARLALRVDRDTVAMLDELRAASGLCRSDYVAWLIAGESSRAALRARRGKP